MEGTPEQPTLETLVQDLAELGTVMGSEKGGIDNMVYAGAEHLDPVKAPRAVLEDVAKIEAVLARVKGTANGLLGQ